MDSCPKSKDFCTMGDAASCPYIGFGGKTVLGGIDAFAFRSGSDMGGYGSINGRYSILDNPKPLQNWSRGQSLLRIDGSVPSFLRVGTNRLSCRGTQTVDLNLEVVERVYLVVGLGRVLLTSH